MDRAKPIPVAGPSITQKEIDYVTEAVKTAWYDKANVFQQKFEAAMGARLGRRFATALPSCTSGLHLALSALGIGPGDEVIVPDVTWIATAAPISYVGATPVFADIDRDSWCVSAEGLAAAITPRTRAAIVVDLYGNMPDWAALEAVAARHNIALIEDAAEAIGSTCRGRPAGAFGVASVFSFHGSKTLTTGEGGMLLTDDEALYARCLKLRDHGREPGDIMFFNDEVGFKYRMSALQAALGVAQLERLDELVARKREIFGWYRDRLSACNTITLNGEATDVCNTYWMVTALVDPALGVGKEALVPRLTEQGISVRPFFYPLSAIPAYRSHPSSAGARERNPVAYDVSWRGVNLPSGYNLTPELVDRVCVALLAAIEDAADRPNRTAQAAR
jgi:perosamine synthetase